MSKYTTQIRYICESLLDATESAEYPNVEQEIRETWDKIFDFDFPIFDENYRQALCTKILRHFWTREIGQETYGAWKLRLSIKLNDIMPYYNQLYKSELYEFNPMYDSEYTRSGNRGTNGSTTSGSNSGGKTVSKYSDTPQNGLQPVEDGEYLTSVNIDENSNNSNANTTANTTEEYLEKVQGRMGRSGAKLLMEYRKSFLNIDMSIIEELEPLFMQIW